MEIYLFRHGIAEDGRAGDPDSSRNLTDEGRAKVAEVIRMARNAGVSPVVIASSPYNRARQTAQIAAEGFGHEEKIVTMESLVPHGTPEGVWQDLRDYADAPSVLLAGHEPLLSGLGAWLLNAPPLRIDMKKAALVRIDAEVRRAAPHGVLRWMITPRLAAGV